MCSTENTVLKASISVGGFRSFIKSELKHNADDQIEWGSILSVRQTAASEQLNSPFRFQPVCCKSQKRSSHQISSLVWVADETSETSWSSCTRPDSQNWKTHPTLAKKSAIASSARASASVVLMLLVWFLVILLSTLQCINMVITWKCSSAHLESMITATKRHSSSKWQWLTPLTILLQKQEELLELPSEQTELSLTNNHSSCS